jgi:Ni/Co efflux regulator RcnB
MMTRLFLALALLAGVAAWPAVMVPSAHAQRAAEAVFNELEKRLIRDFFGVKVSGQKAKSAAKAKSGKKGKSDEMPPGLAKKENLPPGLQKQLQKNGTLPPGLAKRDLPSGLEGRLPKRKGQKRLIVGNDVVLIERATGLVLDILEGVLTN